ncbi:MAG: hypothetical protein QF805_20645, partial [Pirellulaceae bacterium]|nr:hypothetical protein [Pirellulaceae bacterium]
MNCPNCGNPASPGAAQCTFCGTPFKPNQATPNPFAGDMPPGKPLPGQPAPQTARMEDDPALRMLIPIGRSPQAIFAGYAGLISFGCCLLGPIAVALGFVA